MAQLIAGSSVPLSVSSHSHYYLEPIYKAHVVKVGDHDLPPPTRRDGGDAGFDLCACTTRFEEKDQPSEKYFKIKAVYGEEPVMLFDVQGRVSIVHEQSTMEIKNKKVTLLPGGRVLVPSGWKFVMQVDTCARILPRSGLALKHGIQILGGVIDSSYCGEVMVILYNSGTHPFTFSHGDRIAQVVFHKLSMIQSVLTEHPLKQVPILPEGCEKGRRKYFQGDEPSQRQDGGFGSTGGISDEAEKTQHEI